MSCYTSSNLQRLKSSCWCRIGRLYSAAAVPSWRALISPSALLCRLKASWTIITIRSHGSRTGLFTEAAWVLLEEQGDFKVEKRDSIAQECRELLWRWSLGLAAVVPKGRTSVWFHLTRMEAFSSLMQKIQHCQVYLWAKSSQERLKPATCRCTVLLFFFDLPTAVSSCAVFWVKLTPEVAWSPCITYLFI